MSDKDTLGQDREALGIDGRPRRRGTRWLGALCGVALLGAVGYAYVKDEPDETPVVVLSAMGKTTNNLLLVPPISSSRSGGRRIAWLVVLAEAKCECLFVSLIVYRPERRR